MHFLPAITSVRSTQFSLTAEQAQGRLSHVGHTLTEILKDGAITKVYLDFDLLLSDRPRDASSFTEAEVDSHMKAVCERLDHMTSCLNQSSRDGAHRDGAETEPDVRYVIATRHGWCETKQVWKISIRPFFIGVKIRYDHIPHILRVTGQLISVMDSASFWDLSVYKSSEQLLACIYGTKNYTDTRQLVPFALDLEGQVHAYDVLDYVAQHVKESWPLLRIPADVIDRGVNMTVVAEATATAAQKASDVVSQNVLRQIVDALNTSRADDRKTWIEVVWAIHTVSYHNNYLADGAEIAQAFSRRCASKYDARAVSKVYDEGRIDTLGIGSLLHWVKIDNACSPDVFRGIQAALRMRGAGGMIMREEDTVLTDEVIECRQVVKGGMGGLVGEGTGFREKLMQQLILEFPTVCSDITDKTFHLSFRDGLPYFSTPSIQGCIKDFSIYLEDGSCLGLLCKRVPIKGPLMIHKDLPPHTDYVFDRQSVSHSTLRSTNPPDTTLSFVQNACDYRMAVVDIAVTGRKNIRVNDHKKVGLLQDRINDAVRAHVETIMGPQCGVLLIVNNGTINVNLPIASEVKIPSDFSINVTALDSFALKAGLKKHEGLIYEAVVGCPCAFVVRCKYEEFINEVLCKDETYRSSPKRFEDLMKYLKTYTIPDLPDLKIDLNLISFSNGVLELDTMDFSEYSGMDPQDKIVHRAARHHISFQYSGCCDTPLLDTILEAQFDSDVSDVLLALIGRLFFQVGQHDGWQVMPYLVGIGGTGKSLILNVVQHMFASGAVGSLAAKREEVFGMANLLDKQVVMGRDMPAKLSGSLPQEIMQCMTAGEDMEIPRKGLTALNCKWTSPCIMASNHMPDYVNTGNNVGRRIVTFRFEKTVTSPQEDLQKRMLDTELPNIVLRSLRAYADLRERVRIAKGFWKAVPPIMREWQGQLAASTNKLSLFFDMEEDVRGCRFNHVEGRVTWLHDFIAVWDLSMGKGTYVADPAVFASLGFRTSNKLEKACKSCKQLSRSGCCSGYSTVNRLDKKLIYGMEIIHVAKPE